MIHDCRDDANGLYSQTTLLFYLPPSTDLLSPSTLSYSWSFPEHLINPAIDQFTDHLNVNKSIDQQVLLAVYYPQLPLLLPVDPSHSLISFDHHPQVLPSTAGQVNRESFTTTSLSTTLSVQYPRVSQVSLVCSSYKRRDKISQSHSLSSVASKAQAVLLIK